MSLRNKWIIMLLGVVAFVACGPQNTPNTNQDVPTIEEEDDNNDNNEEEDAPGVVMSDRSLEVSFEGADDTRIQLQGGKTVWTEGDHVSVFYRSTVNEEWQFMGKTGDRTGQIVPVDNSVNPPATHNHVVVAYPYSEDYFYNTETHNVEASLPAVQNYLKDSYGLNGNIMISSSEFNKVSLKSVCGWLKLQLTGDGEVVKSITLRGNDGEQVAGELYINTSDATSTLASKLTESGDNSEVGGTLTSPETILTEVTLDCDEGVVLGAEATAFYIALPPQTFEGGFTVDIIATDGSTMTKTTDKALTIERNYIQPMSAFAYTPTTPATPKPANNEIWYTNGSTTTATTPYSTTVFGANIVSNLYDHDKECWIITFDGDVTKIGDYAFFQVQGLKSIYIPNSTTTIGKGAFEWCINLESVNIPHDLIDIGDWAFHCCWKLKSITIPDGTTKIGNNAFYECRELESVTIGNSVKEIGECAFYYCYNLKRLIIPDSVTKIGAAAFRLCQTLTDIELSNNLTIIEQCLLCECYSLTKITIPEGVTSIGASVFSDCKSLKEVFCKATTPPALGSNAFYNNASGRRIYVYEECVELYKSAWSDYKDSIYTNGQNCPDTTTPPVGGEDNTSTITGTWHLSEWRGAKPSFDVYMSITEDGVVTLWQRIESREWECFYSTATIEDGIITGRYTDGIAWGASYSVTVADDSMTWVDTADATDISVYTRSELPEGMTTTVKRASVAATQRFL